MKVTTVMGQKIRIENVGNKILNIRGKILATSRIHILIYAWVVPC
jgi:hypothetical protein